MLLTRFKYGLAALLSLGTLGSACGEPAGGDNKNARAAIVVRYPGGDNTLESNGIALSRLALTARQRDGTADDAPISIEAAAGRVALVGAEPQSTTVTGTPVGGELSFDFRCDPWSAGQSAITVSNGAASAKLVVVCVKPAGRPSILVVGPPSGRTQNGQPVPLRVDVLDVNGAPAAGGDVVISVDGGDRDAVLTAAGSSGGTLTGVLDAQGRLAVELDTPLDAETTEYVVTVGYRPFPTEPLVEETFTLVNELSDQTAVTMTQVGRSTSGNGSVRGGTPASILLEVLDVDGLPAGDATVRLTVDGPAEATIIADGSSGQTIVVTLDREGQTTFTVDPPAGLDPEAVYTVTASYAYARGLPAREATFTLTNTFQDDSTIAITGLTSLEGGTSSSLTVTVLNAAGEPAAGETVALGIAGPDGATLTAGGTTGPSVNVVLGPNGAAPVQVNAPPVTTTTTYTVTATYAVFPGLLTRSEAVLFTVTVRGGLTLNLAGEPPELRSDLPARRTTDLRVSFRRGTTLPAGAEVTLRIPQADANRLKFSARPGQTATQVVLSAGDFDGADAVVQVEAIPDVPSGRASVVATGRDSDPSTSDAEATATFNVERAPVLQSMVALAPTPQIIGVRGGTTRSTSIVGFRLLDDADQPMPGVSVEFRTNPTADPQIGVVPATATSDDDGLVETVVSAGTVAGPVTIIATATPVSLDPSALPRVLTVQSPTIAITGGLPNFLSNFISCTQAVTRVEGQALDCSITLVDRFSNLVKDQIVQFRAEGSGAAATAVSDASGRATAALAVDDGDTLSGASLENWSYGFLPAPGADIPGFPGCTDATVTTGCDLLALCRSPNASVRQLCPLPSGCIDKAVSARDKLLAPDTQTVVLNFPSTGVGADTAANLQTYMDDHRACGFPVSCLTGNLAHRDGVAGIPGDECPVAAGCMDYSSLTACPQDGLVTVVATTRGEESFVDANGNGYYEEGEPFVDLPEPFLDKNDSCSFDEYATAPRFQFTPAERVRHTDLFADVSGDGRFGYGTDPSTGWLLETNGTYDIDTEVFHATKALLLEPFYSIVLGASCQAGTADCLENVYGRSGFRRNPDGQTGINPAALDHTLSGTVEPVSGESVEVFVRVEDLNGNCKSEGFARTVAATVISGPVAVTPVSLDMDEFGCGMDPRSNLLRPSCEEVLDLGAPTGSFSVKAACAEIGTESAEVGVALDGEAPVILTFNVTCT